VKLTLVDICRKRQNFSRASFPAQLIVAVMVGEREN
jgi:hypothetical protein